MDREIPIRHHEPGSGDADDSDEMDDATQGAMDEASDTVAE